MGLNTIIVRVLLVTILIHDIHDSAFKTCYADKFNVYIYICIYEYDCSYMVVWQDGCP